MTQNIICKKRRHWLPISWLVAVLSVGGCGLHLHNSTNEALARKANDALKAADIGKIIDAERQVVQATNSRDLEATRRNVLAERDQAIVVALDQGRTNKDLVSVIDGRLNEIGFPKGGTEQKILLSLPDQLYQAMQTRDLYLVAILQSPGKKIAAPSFPPTEDDDKAASGLDVTTKLIYDTYKTNAKTYFDSLGTLKQIEGGKLGEVNKKLSAAAEVETETSKP